MNVHPTKISALTDLVLRFMVLLLAAVVSGPAHAGAPVSFAGLSVCPVDRIGIPATLLPYIGQDNSGFSIELEADQINSPESGVLTLVGNASVSTPDSGELIWSASSSIENPELSCPM
jgi:hypothetical protein